MKTKFFKKLSFVLALAMVLSVFAPAAGAFAAKKPKLNSTKKYLHLGVDGKDEFDFNISNKQKGWKYYWESANEDIAVVNEKNGLVTATGVGTTKVTVTITDANKEEVAELKATVVVRDNIKTVKISNAPEGNKLAVGQEFDFNRSFVTNSGSTKKTSAITRWTVDSDKATINDKGVFKADEAGKYTVTARSFQSKARYEAWLLDADTYKDYVLAEDTIEITVAASMVEAKQVDTDTVKVTFDSPIEDVNDKFVVYQLVGTTKVKQLIKEAKLSDDKKSAEITTFIPFAQEATYVVEYPEMDDVSFVAARKNPEDVAYIKIDTNKVVVGEATDIDVKLFNVDGVDISDGEGLASRVTREVEDTDNVYFDGDKSIIIYEKDKVAKVTATYHSYKWDEKTGEELGNLTDTGVIVGVDATATNVTGLAAWTIVKEADGPNFDDVKHLIAAEDEDYRLYVKLNTKTGNDTGTVTSDGENEGDFTFESSNEEVLIIGSDGILYPNKQGNVTIVVKYGKDGSDKKPVATIQLTVSAKAKASNLILGASEFTLSNKIADLKEVSLKLTDQLGREIDFESSEIEVSKVSGPDYNEGFFEEGNKKVTFNGLNQEKARYSFKITVKGVSRYVIVNIVTADADAEVVKYQLDLGNTKVDLKAEDEKVKKSLSIRLFGLAKNGTKISEEVIDANNFKIVVDAPYVSDDNWDYIEDDRNPSKNNTRSQKDGVELFVNGEYTLATATSGSSIKKAPTGTYKVTAYEYRDNRWVNIASKSFVVEDTQPQPIITKVITQTFEAEIDSDNKDHVISILDDCFEIKLDGVLMTDIRDVEYSGTDERLFIRSITVRKYFDLSDDGSQAYIDYKVSVGKNLIKK